MSELGSGQLELREKGQTPAHFPFHSFPHTTPANMRFTGFSSLLLLAAGAVQATSSWTFDAGSVSVSSKKGGEADKNR